MSQSILDQIEKKLQDGRILLGEWQFGKAADLLDEAVTLAKQHIPENEVIKAQCMIFEASISTMKGEIRVAEPLLIEARDMLKRTTGEDSKEYATGLNALGSLYAVSGKFSKAAPLLKKSVDITRKYQSSDPVMLAKGLNNLGNVTTQLGDYNASVAYYREAIDILRSSSDVESPQLGSTMNSLGFAYEKLYDFKAYEFYSKEAARIIIANLGKDSPKLINIYNNLGLSSLKLGKYPEAESHLEKTLELCRSSIGTENSEYTRGLNNLGNVYLLTHRYDLAEEKFHEALKIRGKSIGEDHPEYAYNLNSLAELYIVKGDFPGAEVHCRKALEKRKSVLGDNHPDYAESLNNLAIIYAGMDRADDSFELMKDAADIHHRLIWKVCSMTSDRHRLVFISKMSESLDIFLSLLLKHFKSSPTHIRYALDLVLRRKAVSAEALAAQRQVIFSGKYPALSDKLLELTNVKTRIAQLIFRSPDLAGTEDSQGQLLDANRLKDELEAELARQIPEMNLEEKLRSVDRHAISNCLPDDAALIEFIRFNEYDFNAIPANGQRVWTEPHYLAFVLPAGKPDNTAMIDIGEAGNIDALITQFKKFLFGESASGAEDDVDAGDTLRQELFDKLSWALDDSPHVLIAPDGDLSRLPFEVLPISENGRLIDHYRISYLSVGRDMLRLQLDSQYEAGTSIVAADPDFDSGNPEAVNISDEHQIRWRHSRDLTGSELHFQRLPGTHQEGENISNHLGVKPWLREEVLKGRLKEVSSPFILHIATHGFFLEDQDTKSGKTPIWKIENPLLRSGLALSGANTHLKGGVPPEGAEDGILTAEDVSGLDLLNTQMVVLSACETGLGVIQAGEGVLGLRRAFMLAGARTLILSLWKVPDLATPILMERFYENLLKKKLNRDKALHDAQKFVRDITIGEIRKKWLTEEMIGKLSKEDPEAEKDLRELGSLPDDHKPFTSPIYWGAFICQGDTAPISK